MLEESWPHIHLVYECLLRTILNPYFNVKILKDYIDEKFLRQLFLLLQSPDSRERDYLKTIFHYIYQKFINHRIFIRKIIH
jgi:serine/threonine-protein phosphatase 2A regulatory subunit B'